MWLPIWVCLKMGYIPNYSHLIGIMISKTIGFRGYTIFRQTHMWVSPMQRKGPVDLMTLEGMIAIFTFSWAR